MNLVQALSGDRAGQFIVGHSGADTAQHTTNAYGYSNVVSSPLRLALVFMNQESGDHQATAYLPRLGSAPASITLDWLSNFITVGAEGLPNAGCISTL
jgi:hypothetical protein